MEPFKPSKINTRGRGGGNSVQNQLQMLMARELIERQQEGRAPELAKEKAFATQEAQTQKPREVLVGSIKRMKNLADQVPAGKPGIDRFIKGAQSQFQGLTQELPQLNTYNKFKDIVLGNVVKTIGGETGSRLSDQDIERMRGAFPNLPYDSDVQRNLGWATFVDTINDVARTYNAQPLNPNEVFGQEEMDMANATPGNPFSQSPVPGMSAGIEQERQMALDAIKRGAPEAKVRDRFRANTGQEL